MNTRRSTLLLRAILAAAFSSTLSCGDSPTAPTTNQPPSLFNVDTPQVLVGSAGFTLAVRGRDFVSASRVRWNDQDRATTYVSDTLLTVQVASQDVDSTGPVAVTVYTGPPGGGVSGTIRLTIVNPGATITTLTPDRVAAPGDSFT